MLTQECHYCWENACFIRLECLYEPAVNQGVGLSFLFLSELSWRNAVCELSVFMENSTGIHAHPPFMPSFWVHVVWLLWQVCRLGVFVVYSRHWLCTDCISGMHGGNLSWDSPGLHAILHKAAFESVSLHTCMHVHTYIHLHGLCRNTDYDVNPTLQCCHYLSMHVHT